MKYSRHQFNKDTYQLWEKGMTIPAAQNSSSFVVKYRIGEAKEYSLVEIKAQSIEEALEQVCFRAATDSSVSPEDVDLHSVYDTHGKLLWGDELPYILSNNKCDDNGMSRREFLTAFGLANAALLLGLPKMSQAATTSVSLAGTASGLNYVDDVFSTYLYTGNSSTQTINNGIDLTTNGGMVWTTERSAGQGYSHRIYTTARGVEKYLASYNTNTEASVANSLTAFNSNGFSLGTSAQSNYLNTNYVSWTFRKSPKFFDVVTYTGDGVANRQISHSLGIAPGMIIIKSTSLMQSWVVYHRSLTFPQSLQLNSASAAVTFSPNWLGTSQPTDQYFYLGTDAAANSSGATYVAYLFAHDTNADGIIQCGSYTGNGATAGPTINLGWEPQFLLMKNIGPSGGTWVLVDRIRGLVASNDANNPGVSYLYANTADSEFQSTTSTGVASITSTGFQLNGGTVINYSGQSHVYLAIRRPNKPPTTGTQVYNAIARSGTGVIATVSGIGFTPDMAIAASRTGSQTAFFDRLRGANKRLRPDSTAAEYSDTDTLTAFDLMDGVKLGADSFNVGLNINGTTAVYHFFRRAPGFMDVVCYTGTGIARTVNHNLGVAPELMIIKGRQESLSAWCVYYGDIAYSALLNSSASKVTSGAGLASDWNNTAPTTTVFSVGNQGNNAYLNTSSQTYVAYLFASLPGISKVGSYTGNGSNQTINCQFTTGARFVLIKRTDSTGDWYVWDTARGIGTGNDPHLSLNTTAAEVASDDSVDPDNSGFIVNQLTATNINVLNANYIFLAIA